MKIDLYFSYRSPYSYLILPRMLKLKEKYNIEIAMNEIITITGKMLKILKLLLSKKFQKIMDQ